MQFWAARPEMSNYFVGMHFFFYFSGILKPWGWCVYSEAFSELFLIRFSEGMHNLEGRKKFPPKWSSDIWKCNHYNTIYNPWILDNHLNLRVERWCSFYAHFEVRICLSETYDNDKTHVHTAYIQLPPFAERHIPIVFNLQPFI